MRSVLILGLGIFIGCQVPGCLERQKQEFAMQRTADWRQVVSTQSPLKAFEFVENYTCTFNEREYLNQVIGISLHPATQTNGIQANSHND